MRPVARVKMCDLDKAEYLEFETLEFNQTFSPNNLVPFQNTQEIWLKSFPSYWRYLGVLLSPMYMQCTRDVLLYLALWEFEIARSSLLWPKISISGKSKGFSVILARS